MKRFLTGFAGFALAVSLAASAHAQSGKPSGPLDANAPLYTVDAAPANTSTTTRPTVSGPLSAHRPLTATGPLNAGGSASAPPPVLLPVTTSGPLNAGVLAAIKGKSFTNGIGMTMLWLDEKAGFWIGKYEVTQVEYEKVMGTSPSYHKGAQRPVHNVSWYDAREFCRKLTESEVAAGNLPIGHRYALPTEQQWEYAAADATIEQAIWKRDFNEAPSNVGTLKANKYGLYDMLGNVEEWCQDWYDSELIYRAVRGGGCYSANPYDFTALERRVGVPDKRAAPTGFRCVLVDDGARLTNMGAGAAATNGPLPASAFFKASDFVKSNKALAILIAPGKVAPGRTRNLSADVMGRVLSERLRKLGVMSTVFIEENSNEGVATICFLMNGFRDGPYSYARARDEDLLFSVSESFKRAFPEYANEPKK